MISRRVLLASGAAAALPLDARSAQPSIAADLARYVAAGEKASGGPGDTTTGEWIASELGRARYTATRQPFDAPFFDVRRAELRVAGARSNVIPQAIVVPTGPDGVTGPLVRVDPRAQQPVARGSIALVDLPFRRWSTATTPLLRDAVLRAARDGAVAAILVTNGPTGLAVALNAPADEPLFPIPTACLAPADAAPHLASAATGASATLVIDGRGGRRACFNVLGLLDRGAADTIVVSTPRSGWFTCAGERAPGIAVWFDLMRWAPAALPAVNLLFTCSSGHEYENAGSEELVSRLASRPEHVRLWLHLGAAVAARDWQETGGSLRPLPSADPQRLCITTATMERQARTAFAGLPGLEAPLVDRGSHLGETGTIIANGYPRVIGLLGGHRYHHTREDKDQTVDAVLAAQVARACRTLLVAASRI